MIRLFTLFFLLIGLQAFSQNEATLSGRLFDAQTKESLPSSNVTLSKKITDKILTGTITDADGRFKFVGIPEGEYIITCSFLGYNSKEIPVLVGKLNKTLDLGRIELEVQSSTLSEVVVAAKRDIVSSALDKKSFDIANNITQAGGSVLDAMRNLPGVTIDQEGNVLVRGSNKVAVLIDGKQSSLTGFSNQKGLENLPATNIERIEIINNPSAKYDSRGMAGIINIIYKKEKQNGFNGDFGLNAGLGELNQRRSNLPNISDKFSVTPKLNPTLNLNYRANKINLFFQGDGMVRRKVNANDFSTRIYSDGTPNTTSQFLENRSQELYNLKGGLDWIPDDNNTFTVFALFQDEYHLDRGDIPFDNTDNGQRRRLWTWVEDETTRFINYATTYSHKFAEPGHKLDAGFLHTRGGEDELFPFTDSSSTRNSTDGTLLIVDEIISNFNVDYVKPLRKGRFETGSKVQLRNIPISYTLIPGMNSILDPNLGDYSDYTENVYALYSNYVFESKNVDIEGGLRLEQTDVKYNLDPANIYYTQNQAYDYLSLFPSVRFTYKMNAKNRFSAFYNRRVDRPGEFDLRPFPKYDDPEILKTGNPNLRPQFTQTYELAYKTIWDKGSIYFAGFYRDMKNIYSRIFTTDEQSSVPVINSITQNLNGGTNLGMEITFDQKLTEKWNLNGGLTVYRNYIEAFSGTSLYPYEQTFVFDESRNTTWNFKLNSFIELPLQSSLMTTFVYYAPDVIPQGKIKERYSLDLGYKKTILKQRADLTLSATDLLNTFAIRRSFEGDGFTLTSDNFYETQVITLGLKYKF